jgi:hypothetical protein
LYSASSLAEPETSTQPRPSRAPAQRRTRTSVFLSQPKCGLNSNHVALPMSSARDAGEYLPYGEGA